MASHDARDELDEVLDALLQAVPPERRDEIRAHLRAAHDPDTDLHEAADRAPASASASALAPIPSITPERVVQIADDLIRTAVQMTAPEDSPSPQHKNSPSPCAQGEGRGEGLVPLLTPRERAAAAVSRPQPSRNAIVLSEVTPQPLRWLWPGRIPAGKLTVLDGDPGLGKSTLLCEIAARISRGDPFPGGESESGQPRKVLLFSAEDDLHDTIRPRIDAAAGDPQHIISFLAVPDGSGASHPVALPADLPLIEGVIACIDAALVIFDPLAAYLRQRKNANLDQNLRHTLTELKATAERTGAAIVVVRHLNKSRSTNPLYRGHGGIGIIGAARSGLLLAADPDDPDRRVLAVSKGNLARPAPSLVFRLDDETGSGVTRVIWEGQSPWTATQLLQAQFTEEGDATPSAVAAARAWLREALAGGPRLVTELRRDAAAQGIGRCSLYAARKAEGMTTFKERVPAGRWFWSPGASGDDKDAAPPDSSEVQHL